MPVNLDHPAEGTCRWSTETAEYKTWSQSDESSILWLTGNAGSGKTTLTNFLVDYLQQPANHTHGRRQAVYSWFCTRDTEVLRDARSLLRNLIVQILSSEQEIVRKIKRKFRADKYELDHSFDLLWNIFQAALACIHCKQVYIVIDAIDECDNLLRQRLLDKIFRSLRTHSDPDGQSQVVKYLISCQKTAYRPSWLKAPRIKHVQLELETHPEFEGDVERYLSFRTGVLVEDGLCSSQSAAFIHRRLGKLAGASFLWLRVVLNEIEQSLITRFTEGDIERMVTDVPLTLSDAYSKYLPKVPDQDLNRLRQYLQLIVMSTRPLTVFEIDAFTNLELHPLGSSLALDQVEATKSSLSKAFGPLLHFSDATAKLIHPSVGEFLLKIGSDPHHALYPTHRVSQDAAHGFYATACIRYLRDRRMASNLFVPHSPDQQSLADSPTAPPRPGRRQAEGLDDDHSSGEEYDLGDLFEIREVEFLQHEEVALERCCEEIRRRLPAFDYAAINWTYHYARCDITTAEALKEDSLALLSLESQRLTNWYRYSVQQSRTDMPPARDGIVLASFFNLPRVVRVLLQRNNPSPNETCLHDALYWASFNGSRDCVAILLQGGVSAQNTDSTRIPLAVATRGGFLDICNLLLGMADIDPDACDESGQPPLTIAAKRNHTDILAVLLAHERIDCHREDFGGRTALSEACRFSAFESLEVLLSDGRSDINARDGLGRTALHHASIAGDDRVLQRLLAEADIEITAEDNLGRNAVSLAAENGHVAVVKRLHRRGVEIGAKDKKGRNAVSHAASQRRAAVRSGTTESVLEFMARKCPDCLDEPDDEGWSPLAWALDPPGFTEAARVLITSGHVDVNRRDIAGPPILLWAAGGGFVDIVKILLAAPGIQKNIRTSSGGCPLQSAAASGEIAVVRLLVEDPEVDVSLKDDRGMTPADWAELNGHSDIVALLQTRR